jgi:hypothetical protein
MTDKIQPNDATPTSLLGSLTCRKAATWDRRLYFASEGKHAEDFIRPKNPTSSAGFEPTNLGAPLQFPHSTPEPLHIKLLLAKGGIMGEK